MANFDRISPVQADEIANHENAVIVDIRDESSFQHGHIPNAQHLGNHNLHTFIAETDHECPVIVYCYHGNSSQGAAQLLAEQGFAKVYSVDGGYEKWKFRHAL